MDNEQDCFYCANGAGAFARRCDPIGPYGEKVCSLCQEFSRAYKRFQKDGNDELLASQAIDRVLKTLPNLCRDDSKIVFEAASMQ